MQRVRTFGFGAAVRGVLLGCLFVSGCADTGSLSDDGEPVGEPAVDKAGLDNPPVPIGAFFDGAFPPRTPNSPGSSTWDVISAFPALNLGDTLVISPNPSNNRLYIGSRDGLIQSFENFDAVSSSEVFLDLRDRTAVVWDGGFLGLIFHPEFGVPGSPNRNYFYVFYSSHCPLNGARDQPNLGACFDAYPRNSTGGFFNTYLRLSRFEVPDGSSTADPNSELVMLNIRLYNGSHRGGGMVFRNDGYLYVTIGDQFRYETAQDNVDTLEGGTMRFDVNITDNGDGTWSCPPGSHLPRRIFDTADEISGQWYCIPDDNPWLDPAGGVFEEYCSMGHRNPHRLARDPVTDYMWSGEIGQSTREEINIIFCGNNYGWPFREGLTTGVRPEPPSYLGTLTDPVIDFVRSEARAIIGGYVYRGTRFAELYGRYLAGDYVTGNIWAITLDESTMTATKEFLTVFDPGGLGTWGQDLDGEVYLGDVINGGTLYTLDRIGQAVPDPPSLLSDIGAFSDLENLVPDPAWVPYGLNQPFWSDGAAKHRWIALPNDGVRDTASEQVAFNENGDWGFPIGTVLMKHFELPIDEADSSVTDRLETRFLVHGDDGQWYGLTYQWRPDRLDADLLIGANTSQHTISLLGGGTRDQTWNYPSRLECLSCHRSTGVLGPRTHQLNGDFTYPSTGRTDNQLATWNHLSMFSPAIDEADIPNMIRSRALEDVTAPLQDRARSWLDSNCSNCHRPGEIVAGFDMRYTTPFESQGLVMTSVRDDLGNPGTVVIFPGDPELSSVFKRMEAVGPIAMPPLAKELPEQPAVDLMAEWILRIDPSLPQSGVNYEYWEVGGLSVLPDFSTIGPPLFSGVLGQIDLSPAVVVDDFVFRFTGFLEIVTGGDYVFGTSSDDGSKLYIDGVEVVDNDGLHGTREVLSSPVTLAPGFYPIEVTFFERGGSAVLTTSMNGPDTAGAKLPITRLFVEVPTPVVNNPPTLDTPLDQTNEAGESPLLTLNGDDPDGQVLYYDAAGLPPGLNVDHLTGQITGAIQIDLPVGTYDVTASASDGPEVAVVNFQWSVTASDCGNGVVESGEECDDGNNVDGDGCSATCTIEPVAVCGDGTVTPPETCEPPDTATCNAACTARTPDCGDSFITPPENCEDGNTDSGDGCSNLCILEFCGDGIVNNVVETCEPPNTDTCDGVCIIRVPLCGDGFLTPPEQCEDGNTVDGDGCSATCQVELGADLTQLGTVIGRVLSPLGGGSRDPEIIRDGDFPPVGSSDSSRQFDTYDGENSSPGEWMGYSYADTKLFNRVVFQEGKHFSDGGAFQSVTVEVQQGGIWVEVTGLVTTPSYAGSNGVNFETYEFTFDPTIGDAIRVIGPPTGGAEFASFAEIEVYGSDGPASSCGNGSLDAGEECDDGNTSSGDGCNALCVAEFCGDGIVNNVSETCEPPGDATCNDTCTTRVPLCGDGFITPPETCEDGNVVDGDGCDSSCRVETMGDLTDLGTLVASVTAPIGGGNRNLEILRDDDFPPVGSSDISRQYDTYNGSAPSSSEWVGYTYAGNQSFGRVVFQEGIHFSDGGWFDALNVQVLQGGVWNDVTGISIDPPYPGDNNVNFETFSITFDPVVGSGIRIEGDPQGEAQFASFAELEVYEPGGGSGPVCGNGVLETGEECDDGNVDPGDGCDVGCNAEFCGDGTVNNVDETCEPPGTATCNDSCTARTPLCGDGFVTAPETCDDGNTVSGDGCDATCQTEVPAVCGDGTITAPETCEPPGTATCDDSCQDRAPLCGDGFVTAPETCDDGNTVSGDGCDASCQTEAPAVCGDGTITAPETCEPPGTATCDDSCQDRTPLCGDGFVTPPEACDDGNTAPGDGCSATCQFEAPGGDLTDLGVAIARVTAPLGGGSRNLEIIRDDDRPPVGSIDSSRQYDTYDGSNVATEDWFGYTYSSDQVFGKVLFQEGKHFSDGGFFVPGSLTVEVRQGGVWNAVGGLETTPEYLGNNGVSYETFELTFDPTVGDGIRINGTPSGFAMFTSIAELEVFEPGVLTCGNGVIEAGETCDDGNTVSGDGCSGACRDEFCGDGIINDGGVETCEPPGTATCALDCTDRVAVCGDGFVTAPETCEDGNTDDGDGCSSTCELEGGDITSLGTIVAAFPNPLGGGSRDLEIIRDGDLPPPGTSDSSRQFDTYHGGVPETEDWMGYTFDAPYSFNRVVFQEGRLFFDGGFFELGTLTVQVRQGGVWTDVTGFTSTPTYAANNGISYQTYELTFDPTVGDGIRIYGAPGGSADFISVGELQVFGDVP